ncbi:aldehyde oxidase GLOX [Coffea arabica]|uniref:Aldehyde oxidase GLOX n=1 Tax=Coffea arabica TaxID=13443 RepID=A0A6P6V9K8_COFAR|nr:aldehyde oxidase GLOX-like [Coffea arabica]
MDSRYLSFISIIVLSMFSFFTSSTSEAEFLPFTISSNKFVHRAWLDGDNVNTETTSSPAKSPLPSPKPAPKRDDDIPESSPSPSPSPVDRPTPRAPAPSPVSRGAQIPKPSPSQDYGPVPAPAPAPAKRPIPGGEWQVLQNFVGVSAMHMQLFHNNKVVIFDSTNFGPSNLSLPKHRCLEKDYLNQKKPANIDCTAHSFLYDIATNTYRPLLVHSNVWASSGANDDDGILVQSGGYNHGSKKIRIFRPTNGETCDWLEVNQMLRQGRYYATTQSLPDGRIIVVGGHAAFSYEFFPKAAVSPGGDLYSLPFLKSTFDHIEVSNLYPFLHLLPDGNLFIFANRHSILLNYMKHEVVRKFPPIPGARRSTPLTGSSVLLPLNLTGVRDNPISIESLDAEVMICGGAKGGAYVKASKGEHVLASTTCGRLKVTEKEPKWVMEKMPLRRVMPDMLLLPTSDVIIVNGAKRGSAMWEMADDPVLHPVLYVACEPDPSRRFIVMNPSSTPRLFQSSAILMPDGRILVGGSNPTGSYKFQGVKYPTDTSLEAFSPHYLDPQFDDVRPSIPSIEGAPGNVNVISYGQQLSVKFDLKHLNPGRGFDVTLIAPSFTTHSFAMNQRLLVLDCAGVEEISNGVYNMTVYAPPTKNIAPPGYYMMFVVHDGIPSPGAWVKLE